MRASIVILIAAFALAATAPGPATAQTDTVAGHWEGAIEIPNAPLTVMVDLAPKDGGLAGTIDIPLQGAKGLALAGVRAAGDSVVFGIPAVPGAPTFRGVRVGAKITGTFAQSGLAFPFHLGRDKLPGLNRPQEPKRPFPYREEEVGYANGPIHLAATLTLPQGTGPFPAAVLITGSGSQNRDEELFGHKPFLVLADFLTRAGIAVLRADDRGVGGSSGQNSRSTSSDFADDALAGLRFLKTRPEIDARRVGFVGHSEGGIVGPIAAARAPGEVAFVVMIAGTGLPLDEVVLRQTDQMSRAEGMPEAKIRDELARVKLAMDRIKAGADSASIRADLAALIAAQNAALPDSARVPPADLGQQVTAGLRGMLTPWFRWAVKYDPRPTLAGVRCPVLALNGTLDMQVDPELNLPQIERALKGGGNGDVTILRLPGLNHLLQAAKTGSVSEYATIEETMNPVGLAAIRDWILARCAKGR